MAGWRSSERDFFRMRADTSRGGGDCPKRTLSASWAAAVMAWLGGRVRTEKNPGEWPVSRLRATMRIHFEVLSSGCSRNAAQSRAIF